MPYDVELMRDLMLILEDRQASPRATVIVSVDDVAEDLGRLPDAIDVGLNALLALGYIEGPGADEPGLWFFRKLTRKGVRFVEATRNPEDWTSMKQHFAKGQSAPLG